MAMENVHQGETQTPNPGFTATIHSTLGKNCHQCRQKRMDIVGSCMTKKGSTTCPMKFCPKCLINRYGENAEEVASKTDWICPKCRGICNCSICMKKRGQRPTGILTYTAKASGFSSVSELLKTEGADKFFYKKKAKPEDAAVASSQNQGEENTVKDINNQCGGDNAAVKKGKKKEEDQLEEVKISQGISSITVSGIDLPPENAADVFQEDADVASSQNQGEENTVKDINDQCGDENAAVKKGKKKEEDQLEEVKIPQGISSITVSGIDLPPENAGDVFQFLEFCSAFGKALDLREGQAEGVIREMLSGSQQHSMLTQMIIKLLTVILEDRGERSVCMSATDGSWFHEAGKYLGESKVQIDGFPLQVFQEGISEYEKLDLPKRLKLLNFLCIEALGTSMMRSCIDESIAKKREAKEKLKAAKTKVKQHEHKLQYEFTKAATDNNRILLNEKRYEILSQTNDEEVHYELQNAIELLSKVTQECDYVLRTKPLELDENGFILWKLKSYNNEEPNLLLQDVGSWSEICHPEKWFAFSSEQKPEIEKYLSFKRMKRLEAKRKTKTIVES